MWLSTDLVNDIVCLCSTIDYWEYKNDVKNAKMMWHVTTSKSKALFMIFDLWSLFRLKFHFFEVSIWLLWFDGNFDIDTTDVRIQQTLYKLSCTFWMMYDVLFTLHSLHVHSTCTLAIHHICTCIKKINACLLTTDTETQTLIHTLCTCENLCIDPVSMPVKLYAINRRPGNRLL